MSIFVNFDLDLHFQGHVLQEIDDQAQCDHFGEKFMSVEWCRRYSTFSVLQVTFPPGKWRLSCVATSFHAIYFLIDLKYLDYNAQKISH